jgi:methylthioribose-1-phosphate isomerase
VIAKRYRDANRAANIAQAQAQDLATSLQETRSDAVELRSQLNELKIIEKKYQKYMEREPEIRHHLGNCAALAK